MSNNDKNANTISSVYAELITAQSLDEIEKQLLSIVPQLKQFGKDTAPYIARRIKALDRDELEKLYEVIPALDLQELNETLTTIVEEQIIPLDIKLKLFEIASQLGCSLDDDFLNHLHAAEEIYVQLGSYLKSAQEDDYARALSLKEEFFSLPHSLKLSILIEMEDEYGPQADGFLVNIIGEEDKLDAEIIDRLNKRTNIDAANALQRIVDTCESKVTVKSAKRALYVLKEKGIVPDAVEEEETTTSAISLSENEDPDRAYASSFDSFGGRLVMLTFPAMSRILVCQGSIDEAKGLVHFNANEMPRKRFREFFRELKERVANRAYSTLGEIDPVHCRWLFQRAYEKTVTAGKLIPSEFKSVRYRLKINAEYDPQKHYSDIVESDKSKLMLYENNADDIFALQEVGVWIIQKEKLFPYVKRYVDLAESKFIVNDEQRREQLDEAVVKYAREYFTEARVETILHRLRETALVLQGLNRKEVASAVFTLAESIENHADLSPHPFFISFMIRSIIGAIQAITQQQQGAQQVDDNETEGGEGSSIIT